MAKLRVEKPSAFRGLMSPGDGMVLPHRLSTARAEILSHRCVGGLIHAHENLESGLAGDGVIMIRPIRFIPEVGRLSLDGGMAGRGGIDGHSGLAEVGVAVEIATAQRTEPRPFGLVDQRGVQGHNAFLPLDKPFLHGLALLLRQDEVELVGIVEHQDVVAAQFLLAQILPVLRHIQVDAVLIPQQHQPPIDLGNVQVAIVAGVRVDQDLQMHTPWEPRRSIVTQDGAGEEEENEESGKAIHRDKR